MSAADAAEGPAVPATSSRARAAIPASNYISWIALAMMTTSSVASLRAAPTMAVYGLACVFLYLLPAVVFLLPTSLVSAELASGWSGGVYKWVSEGISKPMGFLAVWCQFAMTIFYYPSLLGFVASTLAYVINPSLASSGVWTAIVIVVVYWSGVWVSSRGTKGVAGLASGGLIIGTLIPGVILVTLGVVFLGQGNASAAPMDAEHLLPAWAGLSSLVLIVNNFLSYSGMEMNAVHVGSLRNPAREFPRSIFLAMGMVLLIFILPALAISWVVPAEQLSLTAGIMQAFDAVFAYFGSQWLTPIIGIMLVTASVAGMLTWLAGPSKGLLLISRQEGYLPPFLQKLNKNGVQQNILVTQGVVTTVIALGYALIPSVSSAYWIFSVITTQVYLIMYLLMFVAAIRLRRQQPDHARGYRAPMLGALCGVGFVASLAALLVGFIPPSQFGSGSPGSYLVIVAGGALGLGLLVPYLFYRLRKPSWRLPDATTQEKEASAP
ncbi:APC family permease [Cellulosimicrobium cellulans]|jgi:putative glutamate/gamma-aminobutyrate antiporter|uniref:Amino acid:proton antiporter n=2 Tax=Cellulosimicrobium TaxID=157920 RepID=A0A0H2KME0_9MICO|nr:MULTISPECIES: APC family permease [Cellulosimicrobium]KLN34676.1 amino acid:proton antiporter [Cellulosimicrobium funkei]KON73842.1 amino acid permease [Cellulosimicrobium cellulans F16]KZM79936.1 amino acid:proton antiporter [Cellulosimicrobium sp. I38E]